ncbi:glycoside hydrolase family 18 protein [Noviherbaspirillum sp.]|jgi:chitinase|uniref:glycoside hydrolase family 18 protein n=1 Tax=Noviherbaspirillum sp. TaxID=1926288 RepID=UPI0025F4B137|nr:glycoside hydrolase family 18 protein [Noviherbaspirillum sp.]
MKKLCTLLFALAVTGCGGGMEGDTSAAGFNPDQSLANRPEPPAAKLATAVTVASTGTSTAVLSNVAYDFFPGRSVPFAQTSGKIVGAYLPSYAIANGYKLDNVTANNLTHLVYAFLNICGPDQSTDAAYACNGKPDFALAVTDISNTQYAQLSEVKKKSPQLKLMVSIGGPSGGKPFYHLAGDAAKRAVFVDSVTTYLDEHPYFDGVDIDWESPTAGALGTPGDGESYADLLSDLRDALDELGMANGRKYLLTSAVNTGTYVVSKVNYQRAQQYVDFFFAMTYDYYGPWSGIGHHTPLYPSTPYRGVQTLINAGVPPSKLVQGVATYSRGWGNCTNIVDVTQGTGDANYNGKGGTEVYPWLAAKLLDRKGNGKNGYQVNYDSSLHAYALWNPETRTYIGYDDPRAASEKARFAVTGGLAGVYAWQLGADNGDLLSAMNYGIGNRGPFSVRTSINLTDEVEKQKFFQFALDNRINHVYFDGLALLQSQPALLAQLIADAKTRGIDITLLAANSQWALEQNHQQAVDAALRVARFASDLIAQGKAAPAGLHLDVRPYLLSEWKTNYVSTASQYLQLLKKVRDNIAAVLPAGTLPVSVDVAYWYDDPAYRLTYDGQTRKLSEFTIDATDYTVMLDYRNTADRIISSASSELDYAATAGKSVRLALQVRCPAADDRLCGRQSLLDVVDQARVNLGFRVGFGGFSVTSYESWFSMP